MRYRINYRTGGHALGGEQQAVEPQNSMPVSGLVYWLVSAALSGDITDNRRPLAFPLLRSLPVSSLPTEVQCLLVHRQGGASSLLIIPDVYGSVRWEKHDFVVRGQLLKAAVGDDP